MNAYRKPAQIIQLLSLVIAVTSTILNVTRWFYPIVYKSITRNIGLGLCKDYDVESFYLLQKISGFIVESIDLAILIVGLVFVIQLMNFIIKGEYFSLRTIVLLKKITKIALVYAVYAPISNMILSLITTLHNKPGERIISLSIGSSDIFNIMLFCFMVLVMHVFQKGFELEHEQKLTI